MRPTRAGLSTGARGGTSAAADSAETTVAEEMVEQAEALVDAVLGCPALCRPPARHALRQARVDCALADRVRAGSDPDAEEQEAALGGPRGRAQRQYRLQCLAASVQTRSGREKLYNTH